MHRIASSHDVLNSDSSSLSLQLTRSQHIRVSTVPELRRSDSSRELSWVVAEFEKLVREDPTLSVAVGAIRVLTTVIKKSTACTMYEVQFQLQKAAQLLQEQSDSLSMSSDFEACKSRLIQRGEKFTTKALHSRDRIADYAQKFIRNEKTILTHGFSRVVNTILLAALREHKRFRVIVTEARTDSMGYVTAKELSKHGIPVTIIHDCACAHIMEEVDAVVVGAEAIVENGGCITRVGTFQMAILAKEFSKPFYVAGESFKFTRLYPLNQKDMPELKLREHPFVPTTQGRAIMGGDMKTWSASTRNPRSDYTPPKFITLLFTDLGVLTPSAVSDELIKLYY